jgi:hypothetical protein
METRRQALPFFTAVCVLIGVLVVLQLWLLAASLESTLAGDAGPAIAGSIASAVLLAMNGGLFLYVRALDRHVRAATTNTAGRCPTRISLQGGLSREDGV